MKVEQEIGHANGPQVTGGSSLIIVLAGVSAALHVGKLAPALPVLREALDVSLLQAGFLLSLVQLAGMALGLAAGVFADGIGAKRSVVAGLLILGAASALGAEADSVTAMLVLRALEGVGLLLACMPAPGLIRKLEPAAHGQKMLGWWGACLPLGVAAALLFGPLVIGAVGWRGWWWLLAFISFAVALLVSVVVPAHLVRTQTSHWLTPLIRTLRSSGPWLLAATFCAYSLQWLAVIGFLPSIYAQAGLGAGAAGALTAAMALANMAGNVVAGRLLHAGARPQALLQLGFAAMAAGALVAFGPTPLAAEYTLLACGVRYVGVFIFSALGGLIPATLFCLAVRLAPDERAVSTTVGWMQQWSALGQLAGPPLVALVATATGGWQWTWAITGSCALVGMGFAIVIGRLLAGSVEAPWTFGRALGVQTKT